ncbi:S-protein homolog 5-like [Chenopodium quinoa]|uniref:S-protein homolog 5-like n=1 Tax=Chenopodium quinoa TaxID=63459 RepID=UPI000B799097|nr:S-protein homolog 5-like [Chenopodium quinoa]
MANFASSSILLASLTLTLFVTFAPVSASRVIISDPNGNQKIDLNKTCITRPHTTVTITNLLNENLNLHCQSKDDDLGKQVLSNGQEFHINFKPSILGNTVFFCNFAWSGASKTIDVYEYDRDHSRCCGDVPWKVEQKGLTSVSTYSGGSDEFFPWN